MKVFYHFVSLFTLILFSYPVFAHNGSHESKNCFVSINTIQLRLTGYQFQGLHPNQSYCRLFPYLGDIIIKIESINSQTNFQTAFLQLEKLNNPLSFNSASKFTIIKKTSFQLVNQGVMMMQATIAQPGIYALQITLAQADKKTLQQRFLFLVGVSIAQILIIISSLIFGLIAVVFLNQNLKRLKLRQKLKP